MKPMFSAYMCVYTSEAQHTGVVNITDPQNFLLLYQIGLKLSVGTVLASRQIRWSPNFSRTIDSDASESGGHRSSLAPLHRNLGGGMCPPGPIARSTPDVDRHLIYPSLHQPQSPSQRQVEQFTHFHTTMQQSPH